MLKEEISFDIKKLDIQSMNMQFVWVFFTFSNKLEIFTILVVTTFTPNIEGTLYSILHDCFHEQIKNNRSISLSFAAKIISTYTPMAFKRVS